MGFATWLLIILYVLSFFTLGRGLYTRFLEPVGHLRFRVPVRSPAWRITRFVLAALAMAFVVIYSLFAWLASGGLPTHQALGMAALAGILVNSMLSSFVVPVLLVGDGGVRIEGLRIPWDDFFHWERSGRGFAIYHLRPQGGISRFWLPAPASRLDEINRILLHAAPRIPEDSPSRICVACRNLNLLHAETCGNCGAGLVTRRALQEQVRVLQKRQRRLRIVYLIVFLLGFILLMSLNGLF